MKYKDKITLKNEIQGIASDYLTQTDGDDARNKQF
jgi:hypothetical protein